MLRESKLQLNLDNPTFLKSVMKIRNENHMILCCRKMTRTPTRTISKPTEILRILDISICTNMSIIRHCVYKVNCVHNNINKIYGVSYNKKIFKNKRNEKKNRNELSPNQGKAKLWIRIHRIHKNPMHICIIKLWILWTLIRNFTLTRIKIPN